MNRYELFIKTDYNFIHWLNDEENNYKGKKFWWYFAIKEYKTEPNGITVNFYEFNETGKPHIAYHYFNKEFSLGGMWNFSNYDNLCAAWRYIAVPAYFDSFAAAVDQILYYYNKKISYLCGQFLS
jgi:hypothetical protein